jgi:hypothetical protein
MSKQPTATNYDVDQWIEQLKKCEYIKEAEVKALCTRAKEILIEESNVQSVESPVTVSNSVSLEFCVGFRSAVTFMDSSTTLWSCFKLAATVPIPTTSLWAISLIEASTLWRPSCCYLR